MPENDCGCGYGVVCHTHEEEANVTLQTFVLHAVAELQKKGMWVGVALENVTCQMAYGRPWVGVLSRPKPGSEQIGDFQYVLKHGEKYNAVTLDAHRVLSEAGIAPPLIANGIAEDGTLFSLEAKGAGLRASTDDWGDPSLHGDSAKLTAKLHQVQTTWYDQHRATVQEKVPLMKEEPLNSAMWVMVRPDKLANISLLPADKLRQLLAAIPRPSGQYAERMAVVHGDLHHQNIVAMPDGRSVVVDLEGVCVSSAVQDLVHVSERDLVAFYLQSMSGQEPSKGEIDALWLEAKIAEHVHMYLLREPCWETWTAEEAATRMDRYMERVHRAAPTGGLSTGAACSTGVWGGGSQIVFFKTLTCASY